METSEREEMMRFKVGDTVQLKSGGPVMIVVGEGRDGNGTPRVSCTWFDTNDNEKNGSYPEDALQTYSEEDGTIQFGVA